MRVLDCVAVSKDCPKTCGLTCAQMIFAMSGAENLKRPLLLQMGSYEEHFEPFLMTKADTIELQFGNIIFYIIFNVCNIWV